MDEVTQPAATPPSAETRLAQGDREGVGRAIRVLAIAALLASCLASACSASQTTGLHDGYYTAMASDYDKDGWQFYLTICVTNGVITSAEYNARNASGLLRSWDVAVLRAKRPKGGINPNSYPRFYVNSLVTLQDPNLIQPVLGGRRSHAVFVALARAATERSLQSRSDVALVELPETEYENEV
jgi:major membrane immunogen (membrane-anchored lipoprotein)